MKKRANNLRLFTTILLGPVLMVQGIKVRRNVPQLPEASGPREGSTGRGKQLRILIIGDSAAAGVGVKYQYHALAGQIIDHLREEYRIEWKVIAKSGNTTHAMLKHLRREANKPYDVIVTSLGVNDVTSGRTLQQWRREQQSLVDLLQRKYSPSQILFSCLPPVHQFPSLPQPLRWYLGQQAIRFNRHLIGWAPSQPGCDIVKYDFPLDEELMASDKFHPSGKAYAIWGKAVAAKIRDRS